VRIRNQDEAIARYVALRGIPEGYSVTATCAMDLSLFLKDDECLWSVDLAPHDEAHRIVAGGYSRFIGPDGKVWTFPSNPNFYDRDIAVMALAGLYIDGVAGLVNPDALAKQVELIVMQRDEAIRALREAACRGELR
jgi:hypothetical protein